MAASQAMQNRALLSEDNSCCVARLRNAADLAFSRAPRRSMHTVTITAHTSDVHGVLSSTAIGTRARDLPRQPNACRAARALAPRSEAAVGPRRQTNTVLLRSRAAHRRSIAARLLLCSLRLRSMMCAP